MLSPSRLVFAVVEKLIVANAEHSSPFRRIQEYNYDILCPQ
jgi:hypothetical protein